jgi:hypothetical protein
VGVEHFSKISTVGFEEKEKIIIGPGKKSKQNWQESIFIPIITGCHGHDKDFGK